MASAATNVKSTLTSARPIHAKMEPLATTTSILTRATAAVDFPAPIVKSMTKTARLHPA